MKPSIISNQIASIAFAMIGATGIVVYCHLEHVAPYVAISVLGVLGVRGFGLVLAAIDAARAGQVREATQDMAQLLELVKTALLAQPPAASPTAAHLSAPPASAVEPPTTTTPAAPAPSTAVQAAAGSSPGA